MNLCDQTLEVASSHHSMSVIGNNTVPLLFFLGSWCQFIDGCVFCYMCQHREAAGMTEEWYLPLVEKPRVREAEKKDYSADGTTTATATTPNVVSAEAQPEAIEE